jgi:membrane protein DedA with SNARE-associated domain
VRGGVIIVAARLVPCGRAATAFSAGTLEKPWRRFLAVDILAATLVGLTAATLAEVARRMRAA